MSKNNGSMFWANKESCSLVRRLKETMMAMEEKEENEDEFDENDYAKYKVA